MQKFKRFIFRILSAKLTYYHKYFKIPTKSENKFKCKCNELVYFFQGKVKRHKIFIISCTELNNSNPLVPKKTLITKNKTSKLQKNPRKALPDVNKKPVEKNSTPCLLKT